MPGDDYRGYELLRADPGEELHEGFDGKAFKLTGMQQEEKPSIAGPTPAPGRLLGAKGMGGTNPEAKAFEREPIQIPGGSSQVEMTPEQLLAWADAMENDFINQKREAEKPHMSSVEPTLAREYPLREGNGTPDWLVQYMERQPTKGTFQPSRVDMEVSNKYRNEREQLRKLKAQQT
jgi:hypothetical protein